MGVGGKTGCKSAEEGGGKSTEHLASRRPREYHGRVSLT